MSEFLGIGLALVGTFCSAAGYVCQKKAHMLARANDDGKAYFRHKWFPIGVALLAIGAVFSVFVFGLAGQSELAPMGAVTMIYNSILASCFLKEEFTKVDFASTGLMAAGTTVAIVFGERSDAQYELDEIIGIFQHKTPYVYTGAVWAAICIAWSFIATRGRRPKSELTTVQQNIDAFCRAFLGGAFAGFTGYLTKSVVEVVFSAVGDGDVGDFERYEIYLYLPALGTSLFLQLQFLNRGLGKYDTIQIVPIYQSFVVLFGVGSGFVYFDEIAVQTTTGLTLFIVGVSITVCGIIVLLLKAHQFGCTGQRSGREVEGQAESDERTVLLSPRTRSAAYTPPADIASHPVTVDYAGTAPLS